MNKNLHILIFLCIFAHILLDFNNKQYSINRLFKVFMKKFFTLIMCMAALTMTMTADELGPLYDGTNSTGSSIPVEGNNIDRYQRVQMIYPKADLASLAGKSITKMTFYVRSKASKAWNAPIQIRLAEIDADQFSSTSYLDADFTVVYEGTDLVATGDVMEVAFATPFVYSGSNNLLFELLVTAKTGSYAAATFAAKGGYDYNYSLYKYSTSGSSPLEITTGNRKNALPKTLFTYEDAVAPACDKINSLEASNVTAHEATLTWASDAEKYLVVCVLKGAEPAWTDNSLAVKSLTLDTLKSNTEYDFYVRSFCGEEALGAAKKVSFKTELSCNAPTLLGIAEESITADAASFSWHASGKGETQYQYTYGAYGSEPDWSKAVLTSELSATLSDLNAASLYQVWVRSYCAEADQSDAITEYFATKCGAVEAPIAWDFQSETANEGPACWDNSASTATVAYSFYDANEYLWAVFTSGEQKVIRMNNSMLQSGTALINTPSILLPAKAQELTFDYSHRASCGAFKLNISTDNGVSFTELGSYEATASASTYNLGEFTTANVNLKAYAGKTVILQFFANSNYGDGAIFVDNVDIHDAPSCFKPADLKVSNIAAKSATIAWTSDAAAWKYQLSADGENWDDAKAADTNPFDLSGLNANSLYYVRVQADCGEDGVSEWTAAESFRTECGALSLPYNEDFESTEANALPACWARVSTDGFPVVYADSYYDARAYAGSKSLKFYNWGETEIAILPELEDALTAVELSFWYTATDDADAAVPSVGYITDIADAATFVAVKDLAAASEYAQAQVTFESAPAGAQIAIRYQGGNYWSSLYVDELAITKLSGETTAITNTAVQNKAVKRVINGQVVILKNGLRYNILGTEVK